MIRQQVIPNYFGGDHEGMPKQAQKSMDADAFAARLVELLKERGQQRHGAGAYLRRKYGVSAVTANAWLNGTHKADPGMARRIAEDHGSTFEALYFGGGNPVNASTYDWTPATEDGGDDPLAHSGRVQPHETSPGYVRFQLLEGAAGMGDGVVNEDYPEVIRQVDMAEWEVRRKIGFLPPPGRVQILTGRGPSMRPRIDHGDVVMVDTSVDAFDGDGIYVINVGGETQIKMLQKRDDGMWVVSANPDYPAYRVAEGSAVHVGGRVVATLGVREL